jgi:hypothetical protein
MPAGSQELALWVPKTSSNPFDQAIFVDQATDLSLSSDAVQIDIEALGIERGHRNLVITRKGGKVVTIPAQPAVGSRAASGRVHIVRPGRIRWGPAPRPLVVSPVCAWPRL